MSRTDAQMPDDGDAPDVADTPPPVDQHEVDRKAAQQLLPTILRLVTRRLAGPQGPAADPLSDAKDA